MDCVDTQADCVDPTGYCFRTGFWDNELVLTHRWTVLTPLADCVDTQVDCVDTTSYYFRTCFWDSELVSTHRNMFALNRKVMTTNVEKLFLTRGLNAFSESPKVIVEQASNDADGDDHETHLADD
ncbi:hypothetical protein Taro_009619 [Colocasia esculenta]|uniref:Uncharacterized protein n=1 Tax=Colocasia esculenta TaxID=4460 RepID=A0A843U669_COLES|nr:hypothetical protein [Colocasia esculenta]